jgi:hypothetical protein
VRGGERVFASAFAALERLHETVLFHNQFNILPAEPAIPLPNRGNKKPLLIG